MDLLKLDNIVPKLGLLSFRLNDTLSFSKFISTFIFFLFIQTPFFVYGAKNCELVFEHTKDFNSSVIVDTVITWHHTYRHVKFVDKNLLFSLWRRNEFFRQGEFYEAFGKDPVKIQEVYESWYGKPSLKFPLFKKVLPSHLLAISLDPNVMGKHEEFLRFAGEYLKSHPNTSILELRHNFSKVLGTKVFYRGLAITENELDQIKRNGMLPRHLSFEPFVNEEYFPVEGTGLPRSRFEKEMQKLAMFLTDGPKREMQQRVTRGGNENFTQSITEFREVAVHAAKKFGRPNEKIFVLKLEIPILEVTDLSRLGLNLGDQPFESMGRQFSLKQPGVELFILGKIPSEWIRDVENLGTSDEQTVFLK